jgi:hypothetical protein
MRARATRSIEMVERRAAKGLPVEDLVGKTFGRLTAVRRDHVKGRGYWIFRCTCGAQVSRTSHNFARAKGPPSCSRKPHL